MPDGVEVASGAQPFARLRWAHGVTCQETDDAVIGAGARGRGVRVAYGNVR